MEKGVGIASPPRLGLAICKSITPPQLTKTRHSRRSASSTPTKSTSLGDYDSGGTMRGSSCSGTFSPRNAGKGVKDGLQTHSFDRLEVVQPNRWAVGSDCRKNPLSTTYLRLLSVIGSPRQGSAARPPPADQRTPTICEPGLCAPKARAQSCTGTGARGCTFGALCLLSRQTRHGSMYGDC
jgi:hypothetical protein